MKSKILCFVILKLRAKKLSAFCSRWPGTAFFFFKVSLSRMRPTTTVVAVLAVFHLPTAVLPFAPAHVPSSRLIASRRSNDRVLRSSSVVSMKGARLPDGLPDRSGFSSSSSSASSSLDGATNKPSKLRRVINFIRSPFTSSQKQQEKASSEPVRPIAAQKNAQSEVDDLLSFASDPVDVTEENIDTATGGEVDMMAELRKRMKETEAAADSQAKEANEPPAKPARRKLYDSKKSGTAAAGGVAGSVLDRPGSTASPSPSPSSSARSSSAPSMSNYAKRKAARKARAQASASSTVDLDGPSSATPARPSSSKPRAGGAKSGSSTPRGASPDSASASDSASDSDAAPAPSLASAEEIERMNRLFGMGSSSDEE
jgi:hypothetical protein